MLSRRWRSAALLGVIAVVAGACSSSTSSAAPSAASAAPTSAATAAATAAPSQALEQVVVDWWSIQINDPGKALNQKIADEYHAAHPNVTVKITVLENEAFKSALRTNLQAGNAPDIFQSWGGGVLAEQTAGGLVKDITADVASWANTMNPAAMDIYKVDGKQYGIPYNFGLVGFWYNKELFAKANITTTPTTWEELLADVGKLKTAGVTPIALGAGDKWPAMFYWAYLATRIGGKEALETAVKTGAWDGPAFIAAGTELKKLIDLQPFQDGFLAAKYDANQAADMGNGKAAMELMGQWAPGAQNGNSADKKGLGDKLAWFPFPAVANGTGLPTDVFGGADGFAFGKDAPPEAIDFIKFRSSLEVASRYGALNDGTLPPTVGAEASVTDPYLKSVLDARAKSTFAQLYLDQATSPALGDIINGAIQKLYAGKSDPAGVAKEITDGAKTQ